MFLACLTYGDKWRVFGLFALCQDNSVKRTCPCSLFTGRGTFLVLEGYKRLGNL